MKITKLSERHFENAEGKDKLKVYASFICPQCKNKIEGIEIHWHDDSWNCKKPMVLHIQSCVSGGIYGVYVECPICDNEIDIKECGDSDTDWKLIKEKEKEWRKS